MNSLLWFTAGIVVGVVGYGLLRDNKSGRS